MKSQFYEPYKYWDPFIERENPPGEENSEDGKREQKRSKRIREKKLVVVECILCPLTPKDLYHHHHLNFLNYGF